jgi:hypothetical protein
VLHPRFWVFGDVFNVPKELARGLDRAGLCQLEGRGGEKRVRRGRAQRSRDERVAQTNVPNPPSGHGGARLAPLRDVAPFMVLVTSAVPQERRLTIVGPRTGVPASNVKTLIGKTLNWPAENPRLQLLSPAVP